MKGHTEKQYTFTLEQEELTDFANYLNSLEDTQVPQNFKYLKNRFQGLIKDLTAE